MRKLACFVNFTIAELLFAFGEWRNFDFCTMQTRCFMHIESPTLFARTRSLGNKIPQCSVKCWSHTRPPHPLDTNVIDPWGGIPLRNLIIMVFIVWPGLCSHHQTFQLFNKDFKTVNYNDTLAKIILSNFHWHCYYATAHDLATSLVFQSLIHYVYPFTEVVGNGWCMNIEKHWQELIIYI